MNGEEKDFLLSPVKYTERNLAVFKPNWNYVAISGNAGKVINTKCISGESNQTIKADSIQIKTEGRSYLATVWCEVAPSGELVREEYIETPSSQGTLLLNENDGYYSFMLPETPGGANSWTLPYLTPSRKTTLEIPYPLVESYSYDLRLPENMVFVNKGSSLVKNNRLGNVKVSIEQVSPNHYKIFRILDLRKSIVSPEEYSNFMELMSAWRNPMLRAVMFK